MTGREALGAADVRDERLEAMVADLLRVDAVNGSLDCLTDLSGRPQAEIDLTLEQEGWGRELFSVMRRAVSSAECGATIFD